MKTVTELTYITIMTATAHQQQSDIIRLTAHHTDFSLQLISWVMLSAFTTQTAHLLLNMNMMPGATFFQQPMQTVMR